MSEQEWMEGLFRFMDRAEITSGMIAAVEAKWSELRGALPYVTVFTHLEPAEDPRSFADVDLERETVRQPS